jgi:hypothetical protein
MAMFQEVFSSAGVDESVTPPGMIVPVDPAGKGDNFNIVRLTSTAGGKDFTNLRLEAKPDILKIEPISGSVLLTLASMAAITFGLAANFGVGANLPLTPRPDTRYFKISSKQPFRNVRVQALSSRGVEANLQVAVLKPRVVKLAIRPVMVLGPDGTPVFHSTKPFDANAMVDQMNAIWTPQANVVFKLVSSAPAKLFDERLKLTEKDRLKASVNITIFADLLVENKDKNADLTMFLVQWCAENLRNPDYPHGVTNPALGISLIGDWRTQEPNMPAHEAGHFLGFKNHTEDYKDRNPNDLVLMHGGAPSPKINFNDAIKLFNPG